MPSSEKSKKPKREKHGQEKAKMNDLGHMSHEKGKFSSEDNLSDEIFKGLIDVKEESPRVDFLENLGKKLKF